ncbi:MAG: hypothetical protein LBM38_04025 [Clostridiales bacterium]|jgi:hypothetical protein|nr:hypothetical protein [Clostridiales bacterium]
MTNSKRKTTAIILAIIALLALAGIVYAVTSGYLTITGTTTVSENINLDITDAVSSDEAIISSAVISNENNTLTLTATMEEPGDTAYVTFNVDNVGNASATITDITVTNNDDIEVTGTYTELEGQAIAKGASIDGKTVVLTWPAEELAVKTGANTFSIQIDYEATSAQGV